MTVRDHNAPFGRGFAWGHQFRAGKEYSIAAGGSLTLKFTCPIDFYLIQQTLTLDTGTVRFTAVLGPTEATAFTEPVSIFGKNRSSERPAPYYETQTAIYSGGTITGGTVAETIRLNTANSTARATTVGGVVMSERALPAGTFYLKIENLGNQTAEGVYSLTWEEILP